MENFEFGLLLMVVGMATVFLILHIIIFLSQQLIVLVNKFAPEEAVVAKRVPQAEGNSNRIAADTVAVITAAVNGVTGGKGRITKIEKQ